MTSIRTIKKASNRISRRSLAKINCIKIKSDSKLSYEQVEQFKEEWEKIMKSTGTIFVCDPDSKLEFISLQKRPRIIYIPKAVRNLKK